VNSYFKPLPGAQPRPHRGAGLALPGVVVALLLGALVWVLTMCTPVLRPTQVDGDGHRRWSAPACLYPTPLTRRAYAHVWGEVETARAAWGRFADVLPIVDDPRCLNRIVQASPGSEGCKDGDAIARVSRPSPAGNILHTDVQICFAPEDFATEAELAAGQAPNRYSFAHVFAHELGHAIGLEHTDDQSSVMLPTVSRGNTMRFSPTDLEAAGIRYPNERQ